MSVTIPQILNPNMRCKRLRTPHCNSGFSEVEILIAVCIIGILSATAVKHYQTYISQSRIAVALTEVHGVRLDVAEYYMFHGRWPKNTRDLRESAMNIDDGNQITHNITLGNGGAINIRFLRMHEFDIIDPVLTIRPALAGGDGRGIISWICGNASIPENAIVWGENKSNIPERFLIQACR